MLHGSKRSRTGTPRRVQARRARECEPDVGWRGPDARSEARRGALDRSVPARVERLGNGDLAPPARPTMSPIASAIPTMAMIVLTIKAGARRRPAHSGAPAARYTARRT